MHHKPKHNCTRLCRNSTGRCPHSFQGSELRNGHESLFFPQKGMNPQLFHPGQQQGWAQSSLCSSAERTLFSTTPGAGSPQNHDRPVMVYGLPKVPVTERGCKTPGKFANPAGMLLAQQSALTPQPSFFLLFSKRSKIYVSNPGSFNPNDAEWKSPRGDLVPSRFAGEKQLLSLGLWH